MMGDDEAPASVAAQVAAEGLSRGYAAVSPATRELFDLEFLGKLEYLGLVSRRAFAGVQPASRRGLRAGPGLEFAEHRPYAVGDDFRYLDWAAYGRLERLLLRLFQQDEDLAITLMVDVSSSMLTPGEGVEEAGEPRHSAIRGAGGSRLPSTPFSRGAAPTRRDPGSGRGLRKVDYARRLAAALAYIGLANLDRIRLTAFADGEVSSLRSRRGRGQIFSVLEFLAAVPLGGPTNLRRAAEQLHQRGLGRGLVVVLSDFLDPAHTGRPDATAGFEDGLGRLHYEGHDVWALLVESPEEANPPTMLFEHRGEVELVDAETGRTARLRMTPQAVAGYLQRRDEFLKRFDRWTTEHGLAHLRAATDVPVDEFVLQVMRRGGLVR